MTILTRHDWGEQFIIGYIKDGSFSRLRLRSDGWLDHGFPEAVIPTAHYIVLELKLTGHDFVYHLIIEGALELIFAHLFIAAPKRSSVLDDCILANSTSP